MGGIKLLIILSMAAFDLAVVAGCVRPDQLMLDAEDGKLLLKESGTVRTFGQETVGKLGTVVRLDAFDGIGKPFDNVAQKDSGRIGIMFLEGFHIAEAAVFVNEGVLKPLSGFRLADNANLGDEFDVDLNPLAGVGHLLIGFGDILGIRQLDSHSIALAKEAVQTRDGSGIAPLPQLDPEDDNAGVGVSSSHIQN